MAPRKTFQFTGTLVQPIDDVDTILPLRFDVEYDSPEYQKISDERYDRLFKLRIAKMPELARQLGMQVDAFDLSTHTGLMQFYGSLALNLALKFEIPGFLEVEPKWDRSLVMWTLVQCEKQKQLRRASDLEVCLWVVRALDRDLARRAHETAAKKRARTLANRVSELRQRLKRERAQTKVAR